MAGSITYLDKIMEVDIHRDLGRGGAYDNSGNAQTRKRNAISKYDGKQANHNACSCVRSKNVVESRALRMNKKSDLLSKYGYNAISTTSNTLKTSFHALCRSLLHGLIGYNAQYTVYFKT